MLHYALFLLIKYETLQNKKFVILKDLITYLNCTKNFNCFTIIQATCNQLHNTIFPIGELIFVSVFPNLK